MSLSLLVVPEPLHALGMLDTESYHFHSHRPTQHSEDAGSRAPHPSQHSPALFPAHCSSLSFTQGEGISITQLLQQPHKLDNDARM